MNRITVMDGFNFAAGIGAFIVLTILANAALDGIGWGTGFDSSDNPPYRSGLRIATDHLTGCQYLRTLLGGVTPRMDSDGKQVCQPHDR